MPLVITNADKVGQMPTDVAEAIGFRIPLFPYFLAGERAASMMLAGDTDRPQEDKSADFLRLFAIYSFHRSDGQDFITYEQLRRLPLTANELSAVNRAVMRVFRVAQEGEEKAARDNPSPKGDPTATIPP